MKVKVGMNMLLWGVHITPEHIPVFADLAAVGYDGVEIPVVGQSAAELKTMASACDDLGLARTASAFVGAQVLPKIGPIIGDGVHDTDLMLWYTGAKIVSAYAQTVNIRNMKNPDCLLYTSDAADE